MALALAETYSAMSLRDCLGRREGDKLEAAAGEPLTDLPLMASRPRSFAVPPGIEVSTI